MKLSFSVKSAILHYIKEYNYSASSDPP